MQQEPKPLSDSLSSKLASPPAEESKKVPFWKHPKRLIKPGLVVLCLIFLSHMLHDVEYTGYDISVRGWRVFMWLKQFSPEHKNKQYQYAYSQDALFIEPEKRISPAYIKQGAVYDCRFLATVSSLSASPRGRKIIFNSIKRNEDGTYLVTMDGINRSYKITPLTPLESILYARSISFDQKEGGIWLPLLEKAYGTWRNSNQAPYYVVLRTAKHLIFEGRFSPQTELPGFGASFGAADNGATEALTGHGMKEYSTFHFDCGDFGLGKGYVTLRQMESWLGREAVRKKYIDEQDKALTEAIRNQLICIATTEISGNCQTYGLRSGHAYAVIGYDPKIRCIRLADPYGAGDFKLLSTGQPIDKVDDGIFQLSLHDFNELFSHLRIEEIPN